ncbi:MAG TPA: DUF1552 domain-containing protein [Polyangiaceae bacterium]|nr:DUF1552 domain-containing protein [Polyangiaceae bacterium]
MSFRLSRRTLLRGAGGAVVGLPVLECMLNGNGNAYAQAGAIPKRYAIVFAGQAIGGDGYERDAQRVNGQSVTEGGHFIVPPETGTGYSVTTPLQPLQTAGLIGDVSLVSGLRIPWDANSSEAANVPPGGAFREFHGGGMSALVSGVRSTSGSFAAEGITSDQVVANLHAGAGLTLPSLVVRAQPVFYLSGFDFAGREYLSYTGAGRDNAIEAYVSPLLVYGALFDGFVPQGDEVAAAQHDFEKRARQSVLSLITEKRERILNKVGAADRVRLERHFDEIRDLEMRVADTTAAFGLCQKPTAPGDDPAVGGDNAGTGADSIGTNTGYSDEFTRARILSDLIHMAFVCDLTRVATLQITAFQSHMNASQILADSAAPARADIHEVGHGGDVDNKGQLPVSLLLQWHVEHYAYLLDKLKQTPEGDGTVLDNCSIVFMPEAGHGTQLNDGSTPFATHSVEDMVLMVGGRAGGLAPGSHIAATGVHPASVLVSAMQAAGYEGDTLGEVTGNVPELFG